ncbi:MAG TPA: 2-amino-thiazoline-4-carboxylic acid hydrolase, partial [Alphaproteobacteria bacterium]|nr:2-amino-thiazoline-4-carboxylic acid hydrolase [Alphaproteobacteria bacterium]
MLEQRRIEANILKAIYAEIKRRLGEASAQDILGTAVINDSISQGQAYARVAEDT